MGNYTDNICARIDNEILSKSLMFFFKRNHSHDINVTLHGRWLQCRALNCDEIPVVLLQEAAWNETKCDKGRKPFCSLPVTCLLVNATQPYLDSHCTFTCRCPSPGPCNSRFAFSLISSANANPDRASDLELCGLMLPEGNDVRTKNYSEQQGPGSTTNPATTPPTSTPTPPTTTITHSLPPKTDWMTGIVAGHHWWLRCLFNCLQMNDTGFYWWWVNIDSGNGLVLSGNKP